jgi:Holliday junction resolvase RusA-like endonuclease
MKKASQVSMFDEPVKLTIPPADTPKAVIKLNPFDKAPTETADGKTIIYGNVPSKSNCYRVVMIKPKKGTEGKSHASMAKTQDLRAYEESFFYQCRAYRDRMIEGPFKIEIDVFYPSRRADLDNSLKVVLDCLQRIKAFKNDNNCVEIHAKRKIDTDTPRIEFKLLTLVRFLK